MIKDRGAPKKKLRKTIYTTGLYLDYESLKGTTVVRRKRD
jgi:hypothetical protein